MGTLTKFLSCIALAALTASTHAVDINVMSWNVKRLGHGDKQSYAALGAISARADIIAVQEVMTAQGLERLEAAIEKASNEQWSRIESHMIGSRNYKEAYSFLWRESTVEYVDGAVTYLDRGDRFIREPFSARFASKADGYQFIASTVHILYGKSVDDRTPEIAALSDYWLWLGEVYENTPVIMMGDFNLPPGHPAWAPLKQYAKPLISKGATTLSGTNGKFANLYDNFWVSKDGTLPIRKSGIVDYPRMIGWSHEKSRAHVSDHAPIYVSLGRAQMNLAAFTSTPAQPAPLAVRGYSEKLAGMVPASIVPSANKKVVAAQSGQVRGNSNSKIYHLPGCPSYDMIAEHNRVRFVSTEDAIKSGYRKAGNCKQ